MTTIINFFSIKKIIFALLACLLVFGALFSAAPARAAAPFGWLDQITGDGRISGWAYDPDTPTASIYVVAVFDNSNLPEDTLNIYANIWRADVNAANNITGDHGFEFNIPPKFRDFMQHSVRIFAVDAQNGTRTELAGSPRNFTVNLVPNGYFDSISQQGIMTGWAFDPDNSSVSINVVFVFDYIYTPANMITVTTNITRSDVNASYGVTGVHGFSVPIPSRFFDGATHIVSAFGIDYQIGGMYELILSPRMFSIGERPPVGAIENLVGRDLRGYAYDPDNVGASLSIVLVFDNSTNAADTITGTADISRPDINNAFGITGNHGFNIAIPSKYFDGQPHSVRAYAIDSETGARVELSSSPLNFSLADQQPRGAIDPNPTTNITGYAYDPDNTAGAVAISIVFDNNPASTVLATANLARDLSGLGIAGNHGFSVAIPAQYLSGTNHSAEVFATDLETGLRVSLGTVSFNVSNNRVPTGAVDQTLTSNNVTGWAYDADSPSGNVAIVAYFDTVNDANSVTGTANIARDLSGQGITTGNHGFSLAVPTRFLDGLNHTVQVYAYDLQTNERVLIGSMSLRQAVDRPVTGTVDAVAGTNITGYAYDPDNTSNAVTVILTIDNNSASPITIQANLVRNISGVPGNHGFSAAIPTQYFDGQPHTIQGFAIDLETGIRTPIGTSSFNIQPQDRPVLGLLDPTNSNRILSGYAYDPDNLGGIVTVILFFDGSSAANSVTVSANLSRELGPSVTGNHGFSLAIPQMYIDGTVHTVSGYAIDLETGERVSIGTIQFNFADRPPVGAFESVSATGEMRGWTFDPDVPTSSVRVIFRFDNSTAAADTISVYTENDRPDINSNFNITGTHGFLVNVPARFHDGLQHTVSAYAVDVDNGTETLLPDPRTFIIAPSERPAFGTLDAVTADYHMSGWTFDPDVPTRSINVVFKFDQSNAAENYLSGGATNINRSDVNTIWNITGNHGFSAPIPLRFLDGAPHTVSAYGVDAETGIEHLLNNASISFRGNMICDPLPIDDTERLEECLLRLGNTVIIPPVVPTTLIDNCGSAGYDAAANTTTDNLLVVCVRNGTGSIYGQVYNPTNMSAISQVLGPYNAGSAASPQLDFSPTSNRYLLTWMSGSTAMGRILDGNGNPISEPFTIQGGISSNLNIVYVPNRDSFMVYYQRGDGTYFRYVGPDGTVGAETRVLNSTTRYVGVGEDYSSSVNVAYNPDLDEFWMTYYHCGTTEEHIYDQYGVLIRTVYHEECGQYLQRVNGSTFQRISEPVHLFDSEEGRIQIGYSPVDRAALITYKGDYRCGSVTGCTTAIYGINYYTDTLRLSDAYLLASYESAPFHYGREIAPVSMTYNPYSNTFMIGAQEIGDTGVAFIEATTSGEVLNISQALPSGPVNSNPTVVNTRLGSMVLSNPGYRSVVGTAMRSIIGPAPVLPEAVQQPVQNIVINLTSIGQTISQLYIWALGASGLLALLMMIVGGYLVMTSRGNAAQASKGKEYLYSAIIGLIILLGSYIILSSINPDLINFSSISTFN